ncbi:MAG: Rpn family recombination-promoting nuclease/putative transposase [Gemmatimonadetes bacterium]|nr:Rpn family recombination-promoting nuclease/putative transposase [Gemmatimonadota bacterium]
MSRRHDQSYKLLFSLPLAIEHLVSGYIDGDLARELDFDRVEYLATERTGPGLTRSLADLVCRIHFRGSSRYLLFEAEFQSAVDRHMALRALAYVADAYRGLAGSKRQGRKLGPGGLLPPVLTVTIYNGRRPWTAPKDVFDLIEPAQGWLAGRQPRMHHQVLDLRELARQRPLEANVVSWVASLELDPSPGNVANVVREVLEAYPAPERARLRQAFREWVLGAAESWGLDGDTLERVKSLKEAEMIYAGIEELKEQYREEAARARTEGRAEGGSSLVRRMAALKFGGGTADELSRLVGGISDPERIARIGDLVIECDTGAQLLERARGECRV